jgi:hypothetical protein
MHDTYFAIRYVLCKIVLSSKRGYLLTINKQPNYT